MFNQLCDPTIHLGETVLKIDYEGSQIVVHTDKDIYAAKNVYVSAPLGVLKANSIDFVPELPQ